MLIFSRYVSVLLMFLFSLLFRGKALIPAHVPVCVGDKLKVLYGPNSKESKVTYDAKVRIK